MPSCKKMMMAHNRVASFWAKKAYLCMHEMNKDGKGKGGWCSQACITDSIFWGMSNKN